MPTCDGHQDGRQDGHQDGRQDGHQDGHVWDLMRRQVLYVGVRMNNRTSCIQSTMHLINMISGHGHMQHLRCTVHTYNSTYVS